MPRQTLADLFLELAKPDHQGFSRRVPVTEFVGKYERLRMGNGGSWCRDDGALARRYNIDRCKKGGRIVSVRLYGYNKNPIIKTIRQDIKEHHREERCVVLATGNTEVDHKDGRRDDPKLNDTATQQIEDFQPLSKAANYAKRQHCKECRETGNRFDAKRLGYTVSQIKGNGLYRGSCVGCYWYDPKAFNAALTLQS